MKRDFLLLFFLAVSQILDSLEDTQWLTIGDRVELDFLQKLFEDKQLRTLLDVKFNNEKKIGFIFISLLVI
jgi:hypothetical protein